MEFDEWGGARQVNRSSSDDNSIKISPVNVAVVSADEKPTPGAKAVVKKRRRLRRVERALAAGRPTNSMR